MRTALHGRWNRHSSELEEAKELWRTREKLDEERDVRLEQLLRAKEDSLTAKFIELQEEIGVDMISDGGFRWDSAFDITRKLKGCEKFEILQRIPETNHFHRAPEVKALPEWQEPILLPNLKFTRTLTSKDILVSLPGPYTLARQSIVRGDVVRFENLVVAYAKALNVELTHLWNAGAHIKIDDPAVAIHSEDWGLVNLSYFHLTRNLDLSRIFLCIWFHRAQDIPDYFSSFFGGFFLDFTIAAEGLFKANLLALEKLPGNKLLGIGLIDARQSYLEDMRDLRIRLDRILEKVPSNLTIVCPNTDLTFLPWDIAVRKVEQLVKLAGRAAK